jgi:hypothetical protein
MGGSPDGVEYRPLWEPASPKAAPPEPPLSNSAQVYKPLPRKWVPEAQT